MVWMAFSTIEYRGVKIHKHLLLSDEIEVYFLYFRVNGSF